MYHIKYVTENKEAFILGPLVTPNGAVAKFKEFFDHQFENHDNYSYTISDNKMSITKNVINKGYIYNTQVTKVIGELSLIPRFEGTFAQVAKNTVNTVTQTNEADVPETVSETVVEAPKFIPPIPWFSDLKSSEKTKTENSNSMALVTFRDVITELKERHAKQELQRLKRKSA